MELTPRLIVYLVCLGGFTLAAMYADARLWKIPNKLTVPMFFLGWVFQIVFNGWSGTPGDPIAGAGVASAFAAFAAGFGTLFLLWMIGGGGGGDVKLVGAVSVWLGFRSLLYVISVAVVIVIIVTVCSMIWSTFRKGARKTKEEYLGTGKPMKRGLKPEAETVKQKQERRIMAFALPIALACWGVVIFQIYKQTIG